MNSLVMEAMQKPKDPKSCFWLLPPNHQAFILEIGRAHINQKINLKTHLKHEMEENLQNLIEANLQLDRLNLKIHNLTAHLQDLQLKETYLKNKSTFKEFRKMVQSNN